MKTFVKICMHYGSFCNGFSIFLHRKVNSNPNVAILSDSVLRRNDTSARIPGEPGSLGHSPTSLLKQSLRSTNTTAPLCTTLPLAHSPTRPTTSHVFLQVAAAPLQLYSANPFTALSPPHLTPWLSYLGANRRTMWSWRDLRRSSH